MLVNSAAIGRGEDGKRRFIYGVSQYRCPKCGSYSLAVGELEMIIDGSTASMLNVTPIQCAGCSHGAHGEAFLVKSFIVGEYEEAEAEISKMEEETGDIFRHDLRRGNS